MMKLPLVVGSGLVLFLFLGPCLHAAPARKGKAPGNGNAPGTAGTIGGVVTVDMEEGKKAEGAIDGGEDDGNDDGNADGAKDREKRYYGYNYDYYATVQNIYYAPKPDIPAIDHKAEGGTGKAPACDPEKHGAGSSMCNYFDSDDVMEYGLSPEDIQFILDQHNTERAAVSPPATDMLKLYWDENLAVWAQKVAQSCYNNHDTNEQRRMPGYNFGIGQNMCAGLSMRDCVAAWIAEKANYTFGDAIANGGKLIGHYTQMVNARATGIGCGFADCWGSGGYFFCNYVYGQTGSQVTWPYTEGESMADCPDKNDGKLCDVGKKYCHNGGWMTLNTGWCDCYNPYVISADSDCTEEDCSVADDSFYCGNPSYTYLADRCYSDSVVRMCRRMCGYCSGS